MAAIGFSATQSYSRSPTERTNTDRTYSPERGQPANTKDDLTASELLYTSQSGDLLKSPGQLIVKRLIRNSYFDTTMASIIVFNFVMIIIEADATAERSDGEVPDAPEWIEIGGWVVLILFIIELVLRIYYDRLRFFRDGWNNFDFFVVGIDTICSLLGLIFRNAFPVSALRILRLCKLARMSKIFRVFPELRLMMAGLIGCIRSIFWGMILLIFALLVWAIMGVQFIHPLNVRIAETGLYERQNCFRCPYAYESVSHALLTLLQQSVAADGWGTMTVPIMEEYPVSSLYFIGVIMTISMAVLNLILGVVVNVAMQSRDDLKAQMERDLVVRRVEVQTNLSQICAEMDKDGSGELSKLEFLAGYNENEEFRKSLADLDISEDDLEILWTILDPDKDGQVPYSTFIHTSYSMKQSDTQFMLAYIKYHVTRIKDQVLQGQNQLKEYMKKETNAVEKVLHQAEEFEHQVEEKLQLDHLGRRIDQSTMQPGSQRKAARQKTVRDASMNFSEDDRRILYDILEKSQQWRDEVATSISSFNARFDSFVQDSVWRPLPQQTSSGLSARLAVRPAQAPNRNRLWCCTSDSSQTGMENVVGRSVFPTDDVVEPVSSVSVPPMPPVGVPPWNSQRPDLA